MLRNFDKRFLLLIFPLLRAAVPRLQFIGREMLPFGFIVLFIISFMLTPPRQSCYRVRKAFWMMLICYVLFATSDTIFALFAYGEHMKYHECATMINTIGYLLSFYLAIIHNKFKELKVLFVVVLFGMLVAGFNAGTAGDVTSRQLLLNSVSKYNIDNLYSARDAVEAGLGGYTYIYVNAAGAGVMLLIAASRSLKKGLRVLSGLVFVAMLVIVKKGGLGTAVAVVGLSLTLSFLALSGRPVWTLKIVGGVACVFFSIYAFCPKMLSPLSKPLVILRENMDEGPIRDRVASAVQSLSGDENTYAYERAQLFVKSANVFSQNPLVGVGAYRQGHAGGDELGGHSAILDMLAQKGMVGLILIVLFFTSSFRFFREVSAVYKHQGWNVVPTIYLICVLYAMFSNQLAKSLSGLFLAVAFGYLSLLMQTNPYQARRFRKYERWQI